MTVSTRERLVTASIELFQRQGLAATGIKQILAEADAGFSSLYHHFPQGKDELAAEAIKAAGLEYQHQVEAVWDEARDPVRAMRAIFRTAAAVLEASDYADACPIATVAMEVASTNEQLRSATAEVFEAWLAAARDRLAEAGVKKAEAGQLATSIVTLLEGAFVLSRAMHDPKPMLTAGDVAARLVKAALDDRR